MHAVCQHQSSPVRGSSAVASRARRHCQPRKAHQQPPSSTNAIFCYPFDGGCCPSCTCRTCNIQSVHTFISPIHAKGICQA